MDISPLPHKAPFIVTTQLELQTPSSETTTSEDVTMTFTNDLPNPPSETTRPAPYE